MEKRANNKKKLKIAITTGDQDGVGPEVSVKALCKIGPKRGVTFYLWRSSQVPKKLLSSLDKKFKRLQFTCWDEALKYRASPKELVEIISPTPPPQWVEEVTHTGKNHQIDALVTGPLSKTLIRDSGLNDIGHTEILSRICGVKTLFMTFLGDEFNVLIATGHKPLSAIPETLTSSLLQNALRSAHNLKLGLGYKATKPIALLGLNPHASENGMIGTEEQSVLIPTIAKLKALKIPVDGPLVPDAAFLKKNWRKYPVFVCNYHDQGLIPFKTVHQHKSGCHLTMGLPFIRTSVEHGTAKDLYGKNKADENSMRDAIKWAIKLSKVSFKPGDL